jgi:hypothetical protein
MPVLANFLIMRLPRKLGGESVTMMRMLRCFFRTTLEEPHETQTGA